MEKANGLVCGGLKKRLLAPLEQATGNWVEELPAVLWSLRTTPNTATQYTPFFMVYGAEAVLPHDLKFEHLGSPGTKKKKQRRHYKTTKTQSKKQEMQPWQNQKGARTSCAPIKAVACELEPSTKVI